MTERDDLSLKIPAFLRGELSPEQAQEIEALAAMDADFAADLEFQKALGLNLKAGAGDDTGLEFGWARLSKAIDAETAPIEIANHRTPVRLWQYAAAALACIVVGQSVFIGLGADRGADKGAEDQYVMAGNSETTAHISVRLIETATTKSLTEFLTKHDAVVASGPDEKSQYRIVFADTTACETAQTTLDQNNGLFVTATSCTQD